ncbi:MAG: metal-sensitive transcriptional regulator [Chloroflexia bacterium]|nr:metal-sensitive transcriptional regulator [Chloroflexia bacterium]
METKGKLVTRLRRIEGQVRGLLRMVEEEKECDQILTQLLAVRAALDQTALQLIDRYIETCLPNCLGEGEEVSPSRVRLRRLLELLMRMR